MKVASQTVSLLQGLLTALSLNLLHFGRLFLMLFAGTFCPEPFIKITVLPQITAQAFISFQQFFIQATKQDRHLLVEDSQAVYNL